MKRYTTIQSNIKIHFDTENEVKEYIKGKKNIKVYEQKLIYDKGTKSVKVDRL